MTHNFDALPPLETLTTFLAAAEAGSFSAAAEHQGLTHGSVSRRVAIVEAWLGVPVFERHGRGVWLTPAGQRFAAEVEHALGRLTRSADRWRPRSGRQTVRLSVVPSFARLWLLQRLQELEGRDRDIHVELLVEHRVSDLDAREADLAIRYGRGPWPELDAHLLFEEELLPAAAPALARRIGGNASASDLMQHALLHDSDTAQWRAWLAGDNVRYQPRHGDRRFEDYDMLLAAAEAGLGVVLLRLPLAAKAVESGRLIPVSERRMPNPASHFLILRKGETRGAVLELASRLMREE